MLKERIPHKSTYDIIALRWYAIQAHYSGKVELSISFMNEALRKTKESDQASWFIQDILIDLRNEELELDIINNRHSSFDESVYPDGAQHGIRC